MLPSNTVHKKISMGRLFFSGKDVGIIIDGVACYD